jgi:hypothetical protein
LFSSYFGNFWRLATAYNRGTILQVACLSRLLSLQHHVVSANIYIEFNSPVHSQPQGRTKSSCEVSAPLPSLYACSELKCNWRRDRLKTGRKTLTPNSYGLRTLNNPHQWTASCGSRFAQLSGSEAQLDAQQSYQQVFSLTTPAATVATAALSVELSRSSSRALRPTRTSHRGISNTAGNVRSKETQDTSQSFLAS